MDSRNRQIRNYRNLTRILAVCGIVMIFISWHKAEPAHSILRYIGIGLVFAMLIQVILFNIKPGAFKDKSTNPDEV